jgi:hypothetical protein
LLISTLQTRRGRLLELTTEFMTHGHSEMRPGTSTIHGQTATNRKTELRCAE